MKKVLMGLFMTMTMLQTTNAEKWKNAIVHLKNGQIIECQSEDIKDRTKSFKIRRDAKAETNKLVKDSVLMVEFPENDSTERAMCNIPYIGTVKSPKGDYSSPKNDRWLPMVQDGYLSVYSWVIPAGNETRVVIGLKRKDVDFAISFINAFQGGRLQLDWKKMNKAIAAYLSDYAELCESIKDKKLTTEDLLGLVAEYNKWAAEKGKK